MGVPHLWQISVKTSIETEEAVVVLLQSWTGQKASIYTDAETHISVVSVYSDELPRAAKSLRASLQNGLRQIESRSLESGPGRIALRKVRREDWSESWKRHFKPLEVDSALLIRPSWSRRKPRKDQAVVVLDPGLSFGTGRHPTTSFCLKQLVVRRQKGRSQSVLDIGTGSGILAIAAAKLGYGLIHAFDFDPVAIRVAKANAARNGMQRRIRFFCEDLTRLPCRSHEKFDVICSNLTYDLLLNNSKRILSRLQPDGTLVLAGILKTQFPQLRMVYVKTGLKLMVARAEKEWRSGAFQLKR